MTKKKKEAPQVQGQEFTEQVQGVSQVTTAFDSAKDIKAPKQSWPNKKFGGKFERQDEKENLRGFGTGADMADEHLDDEWGGEGWHDYAGGLADGVGYNDYDDDDYDDGNAGSKNAKVGGLGKGFDWKRVAELSVDFRGTPGQEKPELPQGLEVVNSKGVNLKDLKFEEQADGNMALVLDDEECLRMCLGPSHGLAKWTLDKSDGKVHSYTKIDHSDSPPEGSEVNFAIKLEKLPSENLSLFHGRGVSADVAGSNTSKDGQAGGKGGASAAECVQIYKNGGVGALGQVGTAATALKPQRWMWVTIVRKPGELKTYVNGNLCADVKLEPIKVVEDASAEVATQESEGGQKTGGKKKGGKAAKNAAAATEVKTRVNDSFAIDPYDFALFLPRKTEIQGEGITPAQSILAGQGGEEGTLQVKYVSLVCQANEAEAIQENIQTLRSTDEFADAQEETQEDIWDNLVLKKLYAKPMPVWFHPCFAGLFGDPFFEGTGLQYGGPCTTLQVFNFVVSKLLKSEGVSMFGGVSMLQRAEWQTLNNIAASFTDSVQVALQFQNRNFDSFMRSLMPKLKALKLNESLLVPHAISCTPIIFVIEKTGDETANFTIININPELLVFHSAKAEPPKIRFQTCFVLENVALEKVKDDAFWGLAWWVASTPASDSQTMTPVTVLYQILMPFLSGKSFAEIQRDQPNSDGNSELRTPQRSEAGDLKCLTEAFQYFMRRRGLSTGVRKQVSLLLRLTMLEFVINDMRFVQQLSTAERTLLHIACRQISYSTSKLGLLVSDNQSQVLSLEQITGVTLAIDALRNEMARQPCGDAAADVAPPPLVLCEAESAKLNPSLASFLGPKLIANTSEKLVEIDCEGRLAAAEVIGIYFTASWCKPCQKATLQLADVYKKLRNSRGKGFEIVCVSQDQSQQAFESYFKQMPWVALPFNSFQKQVLGELFEVESIPTLVLLDGKGKVISRDGMRLLVRHSSAFPWSVKDPEQVPHQHSLFDRLLRHGDVDAGPQKLLLRYAPVDFMQQPATVTCLDAAIAAIRYCDRLCTRVKVQDHCVKNGSYHNIALIQYTFTQLVPLPKPVDDVSASNCLWQTSAMLYAQQLDLMLLLQRIMEHFVAAAFSVQHTRVMDGIRMVVPACIAAVSDAVMRKIATDIPSEVCIHLVGGTLAQTEQRTDAEGPKSTKKSIRKQPKSEQVRKGFGLSTGALAAQAADIEVFAPEVNTARTAVLDYFSSLDVEKIMPWEAGEKFDRPTEKFLKQVASELAFPMGPELTPKLLGDDGGLLIKNYPEFRCYRDISFFFKWFLNAGLTVGSYSRAGTTPYTQRESQLCFQYAYDSSKGDYQNFVVSIFGGYNISCCATAPQGEMPPTHRFPSLANPSFYTEPYSVSSENDVLHMWDLPDFGNPEVAQSRALGQQDSEMLLSFLTVPYIRIPLIMCFFSSDDRIHSLQSHKLQQVLDAVLFEPSQQLAAAHASLVPSDVPTTAPHLLATAHGLLLNELCRSPEVLLTSLLKLLKQALDLDTGSCKSSTATVILYLVRLGARVDNSLSFLIQCAQDTHDTIKGANAVFRQLELSKETLAYLISAQKSLRQILHEDAFNILEIWQHKLMRECEGRTDDSVLDTNTSLMCINYAHLLIVLRNLSLSELTRNFVGMIVQSSVFLSQRHKWDCGLMDDDGIPENEIFETIHIMRRKVVTWLRKQASQHDLDIIMDGAVEAAANTTFLQSFDKVSRWGFVSGKRSSGRFGMHSKRDGGAEQDANSTPMLPSSAAANATEIVTPDIPTLKDSDLNVEIDVQLMQLTLKASHPQNLPSDIAQADDVLEIFGQVTMQACVVEETTKRKCYRLIGRSHDIIAWEPYEKFPALDHWRQYYTDELFPQEKCWIPSVFGPVQREYLTFPKPLRIFLPEDPLPHDAQVAYMIGNRGGTEVWKEIFVYRERRMVEVYRIESYGHRFYRSLEYTSDVRFSYAAGMAFQPSKSDQCGPKPSWEKYGAGHPYRVMDEHKSSRVVTRDWTVEGNLSFGLETYIPVRLLRGVVPQTLLETHRFWQDEDDQLRGYPIMADGGKGHGEAEDSTSKGESMVIFVNLAAGAHVSTHGSMWQSFRATPEINLPPARAVILRLKLSRLEKEHATVSQALKLLEEFIKEEELLAGPFEVNYQLCKGLSTLVRRVGIEKLKQGITSIKEGAASLNEIKTKRKRYRMSQFILPQIMDILVQQLDPEWTTAKASAGIAKPVEQVQHVQQVGADEEAEAVLLDLKTAPKGSYLASLADVMVRLDNLSNILAWAVLPTQDLSPESFQPLDPRAVKQSDVSFVLLPRLKLSFSVRTVDGITRLFSLDHSEFYITNERSPTAVELLEGIPHSVLLSNANGELQVCVASFPPVRPAIGSRPFSTDLVLIREDEEWRKSLDQPYFMYPVHISLSFLYSTTLASALYLLLLRFLNRDYVKVIELVDTISTDVALTQEENQTLQYLCAGSNGNDMHPDAHACRLKISLVLLGAPVSLPWDLTSEMQRYITKLAHVSANCRLSHDDERTLLQHCVCSEFDQGFRSNIHTVYRVLVNKNRRSFLRAKAAGKDECNVELPTIPKSRPWIYDWDGAGLTDCLDDKQLDLLIETCDMARYSYQQYISGIDSMHQFFNQFNSSEANEQINFALHNGAFLILYDLLSGRSSLKLQGNNCAASFATMCLAVKHDIYCKKVREGGEYTEKNSGLLSSLLLTMARKPGLADFLSNLSNIPRPIARRGQESNPNDDLRLLLKSVVQELQGLAQVDGQTMKRLLSRRVDALAKSRKFGYGGGGGSGGYGNKGVSYGYGGYGYGQSYAQLEEMAKEQEKKLELQLASMVDWPELKHLSTKWKAAAVLVVSPSRTFEMDNGGEDRWVLPCVSDHSCAARDLELVAQGAVPNDHHLVITTQDLDAFAAAPLSVLGLDDWVQRSPGGVEKVSEGLCFDVQEHPDAQTKVARDMHSRLVCDMKEYADEHNSSFVTLCKFLQAPQALLAHDNQQTPELIQASVQLDNLVRCLERQRVSDMNYVLSSLPLVVTAANTVPIASLDRDEERRRRLFLLRRAAGCECNIGLGLLFCSVISSKSAQDLNRLNPYIENTDNVLNLIVSSILHASRVGQVNRCLNEAKELQAELAALSAPSPSRNHNKTKQTLERVAHKAGTLANLLSTKRHYMQKTNGLHYTYDPRFLLFEFTWNMLLRKAQIELVHEFIGNVRAGKPLVKQMLMGGGKTTVIGPLLTLMLADGQSLVVQMMPPALLEQTKLTLRATFSSIIKKQVFILNFDRSSRMTWQTVDKLHTALRNRGVVLATATSIKSIQLKLIEELDVLRDSNRKHHPQMEHHVRALVQVMQMFRAGVLIMDEVDLLLHPLKSELNFPIGKKLPLDFSPERWNLAIHIIDAVFYVERKCMSVGFQESSRAHSILRELDDVISVGYSLRALQQSPHLVLLNEEWYKSHMMPIMAKWTHLWLEAHNVAGLSSIELLAYITRDASILDQANVQNEEALQALYAQATKALDAQAFKMLNLATDWLHTFLPHCLSKIDRVSFGILSMSEYEELTRVEPNMPRSRFKLAVPFVGKDVPARAAEFAHPDVIIGLTILAYRYEGLRSADFELDVITLLRANFEKEIGPFGQRKSTIMHRQWVEAAGGVIKGSVKKTQKQAKDEPSVENVVPDDKIMVPLWLLKSSNDEQVSALFTLLRRLPDTIHWYLEQIVFPSFMQHQIIKISSSGTDIGGDIIFQNTVGFSGTPSDLLPISLGSCGYERGSEGKMIHTLTNPAVSDLMDAPLGWTVPGLLDQLISHEPHFNALIDTGALITGMSNLQVAQYIAHKSPWCEGVVFLDSKDSRVIYVKATRRVVKLAQCGIRKEKRFAFYDQIHTTGMDIQHMLSAKAVITLGKDMVFRDFAQGAYRMRGIGAGQKITVLVIPEVQELMNRQLKRALPKAASEAPGKLVECPAQRLRDISAWLVLNSMRSERTQFDQLCSQNLFNVWRKNAWDQLICGHAHFKVRPEEAGHYILELLGEAFVSAKGNTSRATALGDKYVAILMGSYDMISGSLPMLESALLNLGDELAIVWVSEGDDESTFNYALQQCSMLAIPFAHAQRARKLLQLLGRKPGESSSPALVLVDKEGRTISRKGFSLFKGAEARRRLENQSDEDTVPSELQNLKSSMMTLRRESIALEVARKRLKVEARRLSRAGSYEVAEMGKFLGKASLPLELGEALETAEAGYQNAMTSVDALTAADIEMLRDITEPPESIINVVECVCIVLGATPDFDSARQTVLAFPFLVDSIKSYDKSNVPPNVVKQLLRKTASASLLTADAGAGAKALSEWVQALVQLDAKTDEAATARAKVFATAGIKALCMGVMDMMGIGDLDEDAMAALKFAEAVLEEEKEAARGKLKASAAKNVSAEEEAAMETELEGLEEKIFQLDTFKRSLRVEVEDLENKVPQLQGEVTTRVNALSEQVDDVKLKLEQVPRDKLVDDACLVLSLMFVEERAGTPAEMCLRLLDCSSNSSLSKSAQNLSDRVKEGDVIKKNFNQVEKMYDRITWAAGKDLDSASPIVAFTVKLLEYLQSVTASAQITGQVKMIEDEYLQAKSRCASMRSTLYGDDGSIQVDESAVRRMRKKAFEMQVHVSRASACTALSLCQQNEERATDLVTMLPVAKRFMQLLSTPTLALDITADTLVSGSRLNSIQARINISELTSATSALENEWAAALETEREKESAKVSKLEEAEAKKEESIKRRGYQYPKNGADRTVFLPSDTKVQGRWSGGGENPDGFSRFYGGKIGQVLNDGEGYELDWTDGDSRYRRVPSGHLKTNDGKPWDQFLYRCAQCVDAAGRCSDCKTGILTWHTPTPGLFPYLPTFPDEDEDAEKALAGEEEVLPEEDQTALQESKGLPSSVGGLLTRAEEYLLRWLAAVVALARAQEGIVYYQNNVKYYESQLANEKRRIKTAAEAELMCMRKEMTHVGLDFDRDADWSMFPWLNYRAQSEVEDALVQAFGLRDFGSLSTLLPRASALGLNMKHSTVFFQGQELYDLLASEKAEQDYWNSQLQLLSPSPLASSDSRPVSWGSMKRESSRDVDAGMHDLKRLPPEQLTLEESQKLDHFAYLIRALDVFVEDVVTNVHDSAPLRPKFIDVLRSMRESFAEFVRTPADIEVADKILSMVSHSVGLEGIETEQCREQEQEKEEEKEAEQEIEMERYVDKAYQRDGEEVQSWAFCTLDGRTNAPQFYSAQKFQLYGRNPLPFTDELNISTNHYNPSWEGDRRLKNAFISLEWIPSMAKLSSKAVESTEMNEASIARLERALKLLDADNDGTYDAAEVAEVLRSAEDVDVSDAEIDELFLEYSGSAPDGAKKLIAPTEQFGKLGVLEAAATLKRANKLTIAELQNLLLGGKFRKKDTGRQFVLLSLAEAETIRCILHLRQGKPAVEGSDAAIALRCVYAGDVILGQSHNFQLASGYQTNVAHNSFRFFNSDTHYKPGDINILLREIPAKALMRRFFFTAMVACRRRMAKRWEQTPLAKLFTFEDQWSMLQQRAQTVRMREAIKARGLLLHDAFQKFDWDRSGYLSMGEIYGALEWLQLPGLTQQDVVQFMRNAGSESMQLSYKEFVALLVPEGEGDDNAAVEESQAACEALADQDSLERLPESRVAPKFEDELRMLLTEQVAGERKIAEALQNLEDQRVSMAQDLLENRSSESFNWMKTFHCAESKVTNPHTTRTAVMFDFARGTEGTHKGAPLSFQAKGKWELAVEEGVKCYKGFEDNYLAVRVPFRKNGGGMHLNQYTISMYVKFRKVEGFDRNIPLLASRGWDQFSKSVSGDEDALVYLTPAGGIGTQGSFGEETGRHVHDATWHTIQLVVDTVAGTIKTYCDAEPVSTIQSAKITKDGQFALRGRAALFFKTNESNTDGRHSVFFLRSATVHARALSAALLAQEHTMNEQLHILDAIHRAPVIHQPEMTRLHELQPFTSVDDLVEAVTERHSKVDSRAVQLWDAIQTRDNVGLAALMEEMKTSPLADSFWKHCTTWSYQSKTDIKNETVSPFGESLLHAAAFAGNLAVVSLLIKHDANVNIKGKQSLCTPLHSAAAAGHTHVCRALLAGGAKVNASSLSRKSALYVAASKGWYDVVRFLVQSGSNPYIGGPTNVDTPMALLRKDASAEGRRLVAEMDALSQELAGNKESSNGDGVRLPQGSLLQTNSSSEDDGDDDELESGDEEMDKDADGSDDEDRQALSKAAFGGEDEVPKCPGCAGEMKQTKEYVQNNYYSSLDEYWYCNTRCYVSYWNEKKRWECFTCCGGGQYKLCFRCKPPPVPVRNAEQQIAFLYEAEEG